MKRPKEDEEGKEKERNNNSFARPWQELWVRSLLQWLQVLLYHRYNTVKTTWVGSRLLINEAPCHLCMPNTICIHSVRHSPTHTHFPAQPGRAVQIHTHREQLEFIYLPFKLQSKWQSSLSDKASLITNLPPEPSAERLYLIIPHREESQQGEY